ncbi:MAG TPA: helix-turn-helix transcriptional regulator [Kiritimatiellia bacterium]|nr:helix-turn-helix transcriptional regulator [Kiritimatiellia bacterium]HMO97579.1 helix-turn-helix transcriptional regulator [Kiritimatiellia bacterium]HMP96776.1 helix-turn-helix transcriptional regulator [Kiritimatiellia bacterium]
MYVHKRTNWEFFAVLKGRCAAVQSPHEQPVFHSHRLWVFPPETAHGWTGPGEAACRVAIFHFSSVPHLLERIVKAKGRLEVTLTPAHIRMIMHLANELAPHYERMTEKSLLVFERAVLELSLLMLEAVPSDRTESKSEFAFRKVESGVTWYMEHMAQQPKLDEVARAIHVSPRHLRRLFREVRSENPQNVFTRLRLQRAMDLLAHTEYKMETIARECGFASNSDFSRVFKRYRGINPDAWRKDATRLKACEFGRAAITDRQVT